MNKNVQRYMELVYNRPNKKEYLRLCSKKIRLPERLIEWLCMKGLKPEEVYRDDVWPSNQWFFDFDSKQINGIHFRFHTQLVISKLSPFYYVDHTFDVDLTDSEIWPHMYDPCLDGYGNEPYTMQQYELHQQIRKALSSKRLIELFDDELEEVVADLTFVDGVNIFGKQVTVRYALFHDVLDACPEDSL